MATTAFRILVAAATAYLVVFAVLFVFQDRFLFPAPQERIEPGAGLQAVTVQTSDNLALTAHWRPADAGKPTVIWFHGNGSSLAGSAYETRILAAQGYGLLLASYRGYGGNAGNPSEDGFYRDGRAAMEFLAARGVTAGQTIVAGNSIGTGTAVQMAREFEPSALILVAPFTSLPGAASEALPIFPAQLVIRHRFDNAAKLPSLGLPILILHGTADNVVPFELGQSLATRNSRVRFVTFDGANHDLSFGEEAQQVQANWLSELGF